MPNCVVCGTSVESGVPHISDAEVEQDPFFVYDERDASEKYYCPRCNSRQSEE